MRRRKLSRNLLPKFCQFLWHSKTDRTSTRWPWLILLRSKKCLYHSHRIYLITIFLSKVRRRLPSAPLPRPTIFDSSLSPSREYLGREYNDICCSQRRRLVNSRLIVHLLKSFCLFVAFIGQIKQWVNQQDVTKVGCSPDRESH